MPGATCMAMMVEVTLSGSEAMSAFMKAKSGMFFE
jgi:hypothetical protein